MGQNVEKCVSRRIVGQSRGTSSENVEEKHEEVQRRIVEEMMQQPAAKHLGTQDLGGRRSIEFQKHPVAHDAGRVDHAANGRPEFPAILIQELSQRSFVGHVD